MRGLDFMLRTVDAISGSVFFHRTAVLGARASSTQRIFKTWVCFIILIHSIPLLFNFA